jgi:Secretion system C-terminal sorting domain
MRFFLLFALCALSASAPAQINVTSATFPKAGDTLRYALDLSPTINAITPPGGNQTWDFSDLKAAQQETTVFLPVAQGVHQDKYPGADLMTVAANGTETYYNATNSKWENMGFVGGNIGPINALAVGRYLPALVERRAPLNFFDINQQSSKVVLPFSAKDLPQAILDAFPIKPDSIRITFNYQRLEVVDGWGTCKIPGGSYPTLRTKTTDYTQGGFEAKISFLGWQDLTGIISGAGGQGGQLGQLLGTDTTITYRFLSNTTKEEIAAVTLNNAQSAAARVRFKNNQTTAVHENLLDKISVQTYPNPAVESVRIDCANLPTGDYTLKIYDAAGREVWQQSHQSTGVLSINVPLSKFEPGTYLYRLFDSNGNQSNAQRLVVLK